MTNFIGQECSIEEHNKMKEVLDDITKRYETLISIYKEFLEIKGLFADGYPKKVLESVADSDTNERESNYAAAIENLIIENELYMSFEEENNVLKEKEKEYLNTISDLVRKNDGLQYKLQTIRAMLNEYCAEMEESDGEENTNEQSES